MKYNYFLSLALIQCQERLTSLPSARVRFRGTFPIAWKGRVCLNLSGSVYFIFACYLLLPSLQIAIKQQSKNQILQPTQSRELTYLSALLWLTAISVYLCVRICIQQENTQTQYANVLHLQTHTLNLTHEPLPSWRVQLKSRGPTWQQPFTASRQFKEKGFDVPVALQDFCCLVIQ